MRFSVGQQIVENGRLDDLITFLLPSLDRLVVNHTGLVGHFDWGLTWEPNPTVATSRLSIFSAIQEQLGLRLESTEAPVEVLVIDSVERLTPD